jgi:hypothetical protein
MRYNIYSLIIGLLFAFPVNVVCQDYIRMSYTEAVVFKPYNTIIVSKTKIIDSGTDVKENISKDFVVNIILDVDKYDSVRNAVLRYLPDDNQHENSDFGCFQIEVKTKNQNKFYYLSSLERSKEYFRRFLVFLKKENINSELYNEIQDYLQRIGG